MREYIIKRLLLMIPTLLGVSILVFSLIRLLPGDAVTAMLLEVSYVTPEDIERIREQLGLNVPFFEQYSKWILGIITLDWGESLWTGQPVLPSLVDAFYVTAELVIAATVFAMLLALPLGIISAIRQDKAIDYVARLFAIGGISLPNFWLAIMVILICSVYFNYLPPIGYVAPWENPWDNFQQFFFPAVVLGYGLSATKARMLRNTMLEVLRQDYIRTAYSKGLRERVVIVRHVLKNAFIPVLTLWGVSFARLMGGTVIIEVIFALPGVGRFMYEAILERDYPVVQGGTMFLATVMVMTNLVVDLCYAWLDPRIRYS
jgi:peptide/nickel transport system permease protein